MSIISSSSLKRVGIIGRPNVGKSTLFNVLSRSRRALVKDQPGVTRDFIHATCDWWGKQFLLTDTGGLTDAADAFSVMIKERVVKELANFDLLLVIVDGRAGLIPEDRDVVRLAHQSGRPFLLVVNKVDRLNEVELRSSEFYELSSDVIAVSCEQRHSIDQVVMWISDKVGEAAQPEETSIRIAIIGKPNVGKSSLLNRFVGAEKSLVSPIAGTTVDPVDCHFEHKGQRYQVVDTAGQRRPSSRKEGIEELSAIKASDWVEQADIVLLVIDVLEGPSHQDARLVESVLAEHKAIIVVANKFDIGRERDEPKKRFRTQMSEVFHFFPDIPIVFTSAKSGYGIKDLFEMIENVWERLHKKISTSHLNDFFYKTIRLAPAPVYGSTDVKFYYLTQTEQVPPSFIAFANHPEGVTPAYRRFLTKRIQDQWGLDGIPVRLFVMKSGG